MNPSIPASQFMGSGGLSTSPGGVPNTASPVSTGPMSASDFMAGGSLSTTPIQPAAQPAQGAIATYGQNVINAQEGGINQIEQGGQEIAEGGVGNIAKGALSGASGALSTFWAPVSAALKSASTLPVVSQGLDAVKKFVIDPASNAISNIKPLQNFMLNHPDADTIASNLINVGLNLAGGEVAPEAGEAAEGAANTAADTIQNVIKGSPEAAAQSSKASELQSISENISPAPTAKEIKLATQQGRIVTGTEPTLLKGGTPDQILTSDKVANSTFTIQKEIPGAGQMSQSDLYTALTARTTEMAQNLEPQMQAVKVSPESIDTFQKDLEALQDSQIKNADASDEGNVAKRQQAFYERAQAITPDSTLDTVWKERIAYDDSIPSNVKNANNMSSESLQIKKEEWLQNRALYNNIINDAESGLGQTSQQAFRDMSSMYDAKANLLSKAKSNFEATAQPSKVVQWMRDHPYITGGIVTGAASATGIPGKLIKTVTGL